MTPITGGYDGENEEEKDVPAPSTISWRVEILQPVHGSEALTCRLLLDGAPVGLFRLPNQEYLKFIRERVHHDPE